MKNWSPDEHEKPLDAKEREIRVRNRILKRPNDQGRVFHWLHESWNSEDEPIII